MDAGARIPLQLWASLLLQRRAAASQNGCTMAEAVARASAMAQGSKGVSAVDGARPLGSVQELLAGVDELIEELVHLAGHFLQPRLSSEDFR